MKSLTQYIMEYMAQDINKDLMIDDRIISSEISQQDLEDCGWGGSFMDDRSWIVIDNVEFNKIKQDTWQGSTKLASASGSTLRSEELFKLIQNNKSYKGYKGELYKNNPHKVVL